jgi:hypothetical protein
MATYYDLGDFCVGNMDVAIDIIKGCVNDPQGLVHISDTQGVFRLYLESTTTVEDQVALSSHLLWSDDQEEGEETDNDDRKMPAANDNDLGYNDRKMPAGNDKNSDLSDDNENEGSSTFNNIENDDAQPSSDFIENDDDEPTINESIEDEKSQTDEPVTPINTNPPITPLSRQEISMQQQTAILESTVNSARLLQFDNNKYSATIVAPLEETPNTSSQTSQSANSPATPLKDKPNSSKQTKQSGNSPTTPLMKTPNSNSQTLQSGNSPATPLMETPSNMPNTSSPTLRSSSQTMKSPTTNKAKLPAQTINSIISIKSNGTQQSSVSRTLRSNNKLLPHDLVITKRKLNLESSEPSTIGGAKKWKTMATLEMTAGNILINVNKKF